jgi:hypothetical protein
MLTISKPLSAGQAETYHKEEFANAEENYYSEGDRIRGEWQVRGVAVSDMSTPTAFNRGRNVKAVNIEEFEPFVDADRAAEFLSIDRETIIRWARKGTIPGHPLGAGRLRPPSGCIASALRS